MYSRTNEVMAYIYKAQEIGYDSSANDIEELYVPALQACYACNTMSVWHVWNTVLNAVKHGHPEQHMLPASIHFHDQLLETVMDVLETVRMQEAGRARWWPHTDIYHVNKRSHRKLLRSRVDPFSCL